MKQLMFAFAVILLDVVGCWPFTRGSSYHEDDEVAVSPKALSFASDGGSQSVKIMSNTNWYISGAQSWVEVIPMSGGGDDVINIGVSRNRDYNSSRNCQLFIHAGDASAQIIIMQEKGIPPTPASSVVGTYVGKLKYGDEVLEDTYFITVTKLSDTAVEVDAAFFSTPQKFNLYQEGNQINFINTSLSNITMYVTGYTTMYVYYLSSGGYMLSYVGEKR